jgi:hypothetical protein
MVILYKRVSIDSGLTPLIDGRYSRLPDEAPTAADIISETIVRPAKAGMFSGRQSHRGKSRNPVAWVAFAEETKRMKPTDKAVRGAVSESPGRNASEPSGGLEKKRVRRPSLLLSGEG